MSKSVILPIQLALPVVRIVKQDTISASVRFWFTFSWVKVLPRSFYDGHYYALLRVVRKLSFYCPVVVFSASMMWLAFLSHLLGFARRQRLNVSLAMLKDCVLTSFCKKKKKSAAWTRRVIIQRGFRLASHAPFTPYEYTSCDMT